MKKFFYLALICCSAFVFTDFMYVQDDKLSPEYKEQVIETLSKLMNESYVFPKVAKQTEVHLKKQLEAGHFEEFQTLESFAAALTESVQFINKDKHMRIRPKPPYVAPVNSPERRIEERLDQVNWIRKNTAGFHSVSKLEGNVGYLDLRGFAPLEEGGSMADSYMNLMATSDAVIVDLRKNGGGSPRMVQYLCSYFFDKKVHLNSLYWREGDRTDEFWTLDKVKGVKIPDVPLFVITGDRTFSAAEEFSYNMQTQKRATLVGQTTGGGANPGGTYDINEDLRVFIPTGRAINPITKTNWEGVGVIPDVPTTAEEAMDKAHELAKSAAEKYREKSNEHFKSLAIDLNKTLDNYVAGSSLRPIKEKLMAAQSAGLMGEGDINGMGYDYLMQHKKPKTAEAIFKINTKLHPKSANVYDSYAECLIANGDLTAAHTNLQKAVELGRKNGDPNVEYFIKNLEKVERQIEEKP